ncbi:MAG: hypothetical protein KJ600_04420 [Nanoarchaeota archaeon]|nr:hypothetical protein [Nanoarchaeota archaeon]MBU1103773.1 hypothetical protein [Nanoarchaeota archaeon]
MAKATQQKLIGQNRIGGFEWKIGSARDDEFDLYIFDAGDFPEMHEMLEFVTSANANLGNALAKLASPQRRIDNPIILCFGDTDFSAPITSPDHSAYHDSTSLIYHVRDCTVEHFTDEGHGRSYLRVTNPDWKKRDNALRVLREVFA